MKGFLERVDEEVKRAQKHGATFASLHEAYAVIGEEMDELWDIVRQKKRDRDPEKIREELVQIAAMAMKADESINAFWGGTV